VLVELSCKMGYDDATQALARELKLKDPNHLRFTMHNTFTQVPPPPYLPPSQESSEPGLLASPYVPSALLQEWEG